MINKSTYTFMTGVRCYTYNHSKYITDALNGFVMQETSFPFIIMLVDDASTDSTQEIINSYITENFEEEVCLPEISYEKETGYAYIRYARHKRNKNCHIVAILLKYNHFQTGNSRQKLEYLSPWRSLCKYEALCEGDDYWTDKSKLEKQVGFLERNESYGMVFAKAEQYIQSSGTFSSKPFGKAFADISSLIEENTIPTPTTLYRMELVNRYRNDIGKHRWLMGDYPMWIYFAIKSKIHFMDEPLAVYRVLGESASHSNNINKRKSFIESTYEMKRYFTVNYNISLPFDLDQLELYILLSNAFEFKQKKDVKHYYKKLKSPSLKARIKYILSLFFKQ